MKQILKIAIPSVIEIDIERINNPLFRKGMEDATNGRPPRAEYAENVAYMAGRAYYNQQNPHGAR
jgi:hypothetical protein